MWVEFKRIPKKGNYIIKIPMTEKYRTHSGFIPIDVIGLDGREPQLTWTLLLVKEKPYCHGELNVLILWGLLLVFCFVNVYYWN